MSYCELGVWWVGGWVGGTYFLPGLMRRAGERRRIGDMTMVVRRFSWGAARRAAASFSAFSCRWVGGWVVEKEAVRMSYCELWVGGWVCTVAHSNPLLLTHLPTLFFFLLLLKKWKRSFFFLALAASFPLTTWVGGWVVESSSFFSSF